MNTGDILFIRACVDGQINEAKMLLVKYPEIDVHRENDYVFRSTCSAGKLDVAKWLLEAYPSIGIHAESDYAFRYACQNGHFDLAKWLTGVTDALSAGAQGVGGVDIHAKSEDAFRSACSFGHLEIAKWLVEIAASHALSVGGRPIKIDMFEHGAFRNACFKGHLEVGKWLHSLGEIPSQIFQDTFALCCNTRHLDVLKWLKETCPQITVKTSNVDDTIGTSLEVFKWVLTSATEPDKEYIFQKVCYYGKLDLVKCIIETFPDLDVHANDDRAYRLAVKTENLPLIRWFLETYPETRV